MSSEGDDTAPGGPPAPSGPSDEGEERALELASRVFEHARQGRSRQLGGYLDLGVPVNSADAEGSTLLMLAAAHDHAATVRVLLERGADPDRVDARGRTPLAAAVVTGGRAVVEALLAADADPYRGTPSAVETVRFFDRRDLADLFDDAGDDTGDDTGDDRA